MKIYIGIVAGLALALFIYLFPSLSIFPHKYIILSCFLILSVFAEYIPVTLPHGGHMTIGFPIDFVLILVYGPATAMLITSLSLVIYETVKGKSPWYKRIFDASQYALSAGLAGLVYQYTGGVIGFQNFFKFIIPASLCALTYCLVNLTLVTFVISFYEGSKISKVWRLNFKDNLPTYLSEAPLGLLMAIIYVQVGILGIGLFFLPLLLARRSFELYTKMRQMYLDTIRALAAAIDAKDPYTKGHSERVSRVAVALGQLMSLSADELERLEYSALLHDIGKIGIDEAILRKSDGLSEEEYDKIKNHSALGAKIIEPVDFLKKSYETIYHHHEKFNGGGYPDKIKGEEIPLAARIIAVADAYDAMSSDRPYRKRLDRKQILKELEEQSGRQFDPEVVKILITMLEKGEEI